jgi:glycosyltransferase involved in cell wall biosynthesis
MKILMFCQLFPPLVYGGGEVLFWNLAKSLAAQGNQVHVITERVRGQKDRETISGVSIRRVGLAGKYKGALTTSFLESLAFMVEALIAGIGQISRNGADIIHSNTYVPALVGQVCATLFRRKHVVTVHDVYLISMPWFWEKWSRQRGTGFTARFLGPVLEKSLLQLPVDVIHTVSETSRDDLISMGVRSRIVVVPNGINPSEYEINEPSAVNPHQAIYVGRLVFYKNLDVIFRAFIRVVESIPDATLSIVGDGSMRAIWEKTVAELGLANNVKFYGSVSNREKIRSLRESAYLILPSLVEGFGIVVLEAFACTKAALASDIGALRELITDGVDGLLMNAYSEDEWAKKMIYLFTHPADARKLGRMGKLKLDATYSSQHVARQMETLYRNCLKQVQLPPERHLQRAR